MVPLDLGAAGSPDMAISSIECSTYEVATDQPEADGTLAWDKTVIVIVEARAANSLGLGWTYASAASQLVIETSLADAVTGIDALDVPAAHEAMVRACRNFGRPGVVSCAISAVDIALWDLKAKLLGVPLARLFGRCRDAIPIYGSGGFTTYDDVTTEAQLSRWTGELGLSRVKIKIGESWGSNEERDLARVALARRTVGADVELYVDANGGYRRKQAVRMGRLLSAEHGVTWFEEPVSSDDLSGLREVRDQVAADVTAGEYGFDEHYFAQMIEARAIDCLQIDATRCGGYTSWLRAAALAGAHNLDVSAHCAPHLHTPVAASIPNLRHVEYFHDHVRLDAMLFDGLPRLVCGTLVVDTEQPGHGISLRQDATKFRIR